MEFEENNLRNTRPARPRRAKALNAFKNISQAFNDSDDEDDKTKPSTKPRKTLNFENEVVSDYEKIRLRNIAEREKMFKDFKLKNLASNLTKTLPKSKEMGASKPLWDSKDDPEYMPQSRYHNSVTKKITPNKRLLRKKKSNNSGQNYSGKKSTRLKTAHILLPENCGKMNKIWNKFCLFAKKEENFVEDDFIGFLEAEISVLCKDPTDSKTALRTCKREHS